MRRQQDYSSLPRESDVERHVDWDPRAADRRKDKPAEGSGSPGRCDTAAARSPDYSSLPRESDLERFVGWSETPTAARPLCEPQSWAQ